MAFTDVYGPQDWTAGTFTVTTPDTGDGNYPETIYREKVFTTNAAGPAGERIIDSADYGASAHTIFGFATLGVDTGYVDLRGVGNGIYIDIDVKFDPAVSADIGNFAYPFTLGTRRASPESFRYTFQLRVAMDEGLIYTDNRGNGEGAGFGSISADDQWYTLRTFLKPSSDNGSTADGIIRVWIKPSTSPASSFALISEVTNSFLWNSAFLGAPDYGFNYVNFGRYGILPTTNFRIFYGEEDAEKQVFMFGRADSGVAKVVSDLTALFNLDGVSRTVDAEGSHVIGGNLALIEQATPPVGIANMGLIYAEDNGSGKTRLMVQFGTGSPVQIAIEP